MPGDAHSADDRARDTGVCVCLCTCPDLDSARALALALVDARLVACASLLPGLESVYRWQGAIERAQEVQLILKTTLECLPALQARVRALHPYDCPELIALEAVAGLPAYLDWVRSGCARNDGDA